MKTASKILQIQGVGYDWRDKEVFNDKHQIGFIAQDLERIYPEVVKTDERTGMKSVMYDKLVAPLIEAFKVLYGRVHGVEREVASMKAAVDADSQAKDLKIQSLESQLEHLQNEVANAKQENKLLMRAVCEVNPKAEICGK